MGNLRTSGTTIDSTVLFGAEIAFGDRTTDVSELPAALDNIKEHFQTDPVKEIDFLPYTSTYTPSRSSRWG